MPKPRSTKMYSFRVRIDGEDDEKLILFCKEHTDVYLLVHHVTPTKNPHFHIYVETHISQANFSNKIKAVLKVTGSDYSNQRCDQDRKIEYLSYLFNTKKGNQPRVVAYEGFSVIDIATYRENSQQIAREFAERMKNVKHSQIDVAYIVLERFETEKFVFLPETIYDVVITVLKEMRMMARPNHVKDIIATVMAYAGDKRANCAIKDITLKFFSIT